MRRGFRSQATFPIRRQGQPIGAISIYSNEANCFDTENVALLTELAADVFFALESIETERLRALAASELDQFFALSLDMLCILDWAGYFQRVNPAWERTLGFTADELCGRPWIDFVHPDDVPRGVDARARVRSGREVRDLEVRFLSKSGDYRWLVGSAAPARDQKLVFVAMSDITERKLLEEQLRTRT